MDFDPNAIQVMVGCGPDGEHTLPFAVLEFSIRRRTDRLVQVTSLADVEREIPIPVPKNPNNRAVTSFSFQRFLIPQALGFKGCGIYLDNDQLLQADIGGLWDTPFPDGCQVNMCPGWQSAVMLISSEVGWYVGAFIDLLNRQAISYKDLVNVKRVAKCGNTLDPLWNTIDRPSAIDMDVKNAKLLHYTDMGIQPWLFAHHPHGGVWVRELKAAVDDGFIGVDDVMREIEAGHVRPSLAVAVGEEPPYADEEFVFPDARRKQVA